MLADEPTGNLDTKSADGVFELMRQVNRDSGTSFLLVTHNLDLARRCDRIIEVVDGRIQAERSDGRCTWRSTDTNFSGATECAARMHGRGSTAPLLDYQRLEPRFECVRAVLACVC